MVKISFDRRVYESVDNTSLSRIASQKSTENRIQAANG